MLSTSLRLEDLLISLNHWEHCNLGILLLFLESALQYKGIFSELDVTSWLQVLCHTDGLLEVCNLNLI